jgi:hypothetical protein
LRNICSWCLEIISGRHGVCGSLLVGGESYGTAEEGAGAIAADLAAVG